MRLCWCFCSAPGADWFRWDLLNSLLKRARLLYSPFLLHSLAAPTATNYRISWSHEDAGVIADVTARTDRQCSEPDVCLFYWWLGSQGWSEAFCINRDANYYVFLVSIGRLLHFVYSTPSLSSFYLWSLFAPFYSPTNTNKSNTILWISPHAQVWNPLLLGPESQLHHDSLLLESLFINHRDNTYRFTKL